MIDSVSVDEILKDGSTRKVHQSNHDNGEHNILCTFNSIIDIDFAVLRIIQAEFNNPKYVDQSVMKLSTKEIKKRLVNRMDTNPVTICIPYKEIADGIYNEIMSTKYARLIGNYYSETGVFTLMSVYNNIDRTNVTILCQTEEEARIVHVYNKTLKTKIISNPEKDIRIDDYDEFFFKNKNDVYMFQQKFKEKRVIFLNYRFNVYIDKKPYPDLEVSRWLYYNTLSTTAIVDVYSKKDPNYASLEITVKAEDLKKSAEAEKTKTDKKLHKEDKE